MLSGNCRCSGTADGPLACQDRRGSVAPILTLAIRVTGEIDDDISRLQRVPSELVKGAPLRASRHTENQHARQVWEIMRQPTALLRSHFSLGNRQSFTDWRTADAMRRPPDTDGATTRLAPAP